MFTVETLKNATLTCEYKNLVDIQQSLSGVSDIFSDTGQSGMVRREDFAKADVAKNAFFVHHVMVVVTHK